MGEDGGIALSVVVPAFDEANRIAGTLTSLHEHLRGRGSGFEIIVVDDGSTDDTAGLVSRSKLEGVRLLAHRPNRGKGFAVRAGALAAEGARVLLCDADLSTPIEELSRLELRLDDGADIAIGSRAAPGAAVLAPQPWRRRMLGRNFNRVVRLLGLRGFADTQCGFKLFTRAAARAVFACTECDGWAFDVEALLVARKLGLRVDEVAVRWSHCEDSRLRVGRDFLPTLLDLARIRGRWLLRDPAAKGTLRPGPPSSHPAARVEVAGSGSGAEGEDGVVPRSAGSA